MAELNEGELVSSGALPPNDFTNSIERIVEVANFDLQLDPEKYNQALTEASDLAIDPEVIRSIVSAIQAGNIVLQGPPGTGKSSLAMAIARAFNVATTLVTAHDDWTIYDVIGRLELKLTDDHKEQVVPVNGCFTETVINCANAIVNNFDDPDSVQAEWLVIDELNRAHLDKAFGELFSVLGTDDLVPVDLPHQTEGNKQLVIPRRFRIIATLNSYDRQFVNNLSQAIRRRFTFITIDIPQKKPNGLTWELDENTENPALKELYHICMKACARIARRMTSLNPDEYSEKLKELFGTIKGDLFGYIHKLMNLLESIRYSTSEKIPYLPIGTAQIIDTVELFLIQYLQSDKSEEQTKAALDWAFSVKIVPLLEADIIDQELLFELIKSLDSPFNKMTKRELSIIANAGLSYVPWD